jgi:stage V sporulation protein AB
MLTLLIILIGLGSGIVISGAVFAFITIVGVVPRLSQRTNTVNCIKIYEEAIILGGVVGVLTLYTNISLNIGYLGAIIFALSVGIFYGCLAVSLAETLDVIPILSRRLDVKNGIKFFILSLAVGKLIGSLVYYFIDGFYKR